MILTCSVLHRFFYWLPLWVSWQKLISHRCPSKMLHYHAVFVFSEPMCLAFLIKTLRETSAVWFSVSLFFFNNYPRTQTRMVINVNHMLFASPTRHSSRRKLFNLHLSRRNKKKLSNRSKFFIKTLMWTIRNRFV